MIFRYFLVGYVRGVLKATLHCFTRCKRLSAGEGRVLAPSFQATLPNFFPVFLCSTCLKSKRNPKTRSLLVNQLSSDSAFHHHQLWGHPYPPRLHKGCETRLGNNRWWRLGFVRNDLAANSIAVQLEAKQEEEVADAKVSLLDASSARASVPVEADDVLSSWLPRIFLCMWCFWRSVSKQHRGTSDTYIWSCFINSYFWLEVLEKLDYHNFLHLSSRQSVEQVQTQSTRRNATDS